MDWRLLELTVKLKQNEEGAVTGFDLVSLEPESGEATTLFNFPYCPDDHKDFDEAIAKEV